MTRAILATLIFSTLVYAEETLKNGQPRPHIKFFACKHPENVEEMDKLNNEVNGFLSDPSVIYHNHAQYTRKSGFTIGLTYFKRDMEKLTEEEKKNIPSSPKLAYFVKKLPADDDQADAELLAMERDINEWLTQTDVEPLFQAISDDANAGFIVTIIYREIE